MFTIDEKNKMTIVKGDTAIITLSLSEYTLIQGDQVKFTVKKSANAKDTIISKVVTEFVEGKAIIALEEGDTTINAGDYVYEIEVRLANGTVDTVIQATKFKVIADLS